MPAVGCSSSMGVAVDAFLFALACVVQGVVYPGFRWVDEKRMPRWHRDYTRAIVVLTLPAMVLQLGLHLWYLRAHVTIESGLQLGCVVLTWVVTFAAAVPIHRAIAHQGLSEERIRKLLRVHAIRTMAWGLVVVVNLFNIDQL